jgi:hypothetical protein
MESFLTEQNQEAGYTGGNTPPAGTDVIAPASQRQKHEVGGLEGPLVGSCGHHATVRVPSGKGTARRRGRGRMQALHAHLVQRCASLRVRLCRVRGLQG